MPSLLAHALKQEIGLPVAHLLVLVRTAPQLFKLPTSRGLKDSLKRLDERFSGSLGESPRLPTEYLLRHLMRAEQTVNEMAQEVLCRQARAVGRGAGGRRRDSGR